MSIKASMATAYRRPRPRLEGQTNPAMQPKQSPYGDGARVVPRKIGMRALAAKKLQRAR